VPERHHLSSAAHCSCHAAPTAAIAPWACALDIIRACADYRMPIHPFTEHFSSRETFHIGALPMIGASRLLGKGQAGTPIHLTTARKPPRGGARMSQCQGPRARSIRPSRRSRPGRDRSLGWAATLSATGREWCGA